MCGEPARSRQGGARRQPSLSVGGAPSPLLPAEEPESRSPLVNWHNLRCVCVWGGGGSFPKTPESTFPAPAVPSLEGAAGRPATRSLNWGKKQPPQQQQQPPPSDRPPLAQRWWRRRRKREAGRRGAAPQRKRGTASPPPRPSSRRLRGGPPDPNGDRGRKHLARARRLFLPQAAPTFSSSFQPGPAGRNSERGSGGAPAMAPTSPPLWMAALQPPPARPSGAFAPPADFAAVCEAGARAAGKGSRGAQPPPRLPPSLPDGGRGVFLPGHRHAGLPLPLRQGPQPPTRAPPGHPSRAPAKGVALEGVPCPRGGWAPPPTVSDAVPAAAPPVWRPRGGGGGWRCWAGGPGLRHTGQLAAVKAKPGGGGGAAAAALPAPPASLTPPPPEPRRSPAPGEGPLRPRSPQGPGSANPPPRPPGSPPGLPPAPPPHAGCAAPPRPPGSLDGTQQQQKPPPAQADLPPSFRVKLSASKTSPSPSSAGPPNRGTGAGSFLPSHSSRTQGGFIPVRALSRQTPLAAGVGFPESLLASSGGAEGEQATCRGLDDHWKDVVTGKRPGFTSLWFSCIT